MGKRGNITMQLPAALVDKLAPLLPEKPQGLYPFAVSESQVDEQSQKALEQSGITDRKGLLTPDWQKVLRILGDASAMTRFMMLIEGELMEYQVFFEKNTDTCVSLSRNKDGFVLEAPALCSDLLEAITDFSGNSLTGLVPVLGEMPIAEALCALGAADITRRELMQALAADSAWQPAGISSASINRLLQRKDLNSGWLTWFLQSLLHQPYEVDQNSVDKAMKSLEKKGWLKPHKDGFVPHADLMQLATRLLMINILYKIDGLRLTDTGKPVRQTFGIVQNGTRDILFIEATGNDVFLGGLTGRALFLLLEKYLTQAEAVSLPEQAIDELQCAACGKPADAEAKFCKFCGVPHQKTEEPARFCAKCGTQRKPGKKFCTKCGGSYS